MKLKRILVIDDDPLVRRTLHVLLNQAGYTVDSAADGLEGVVDLREHGDRGHAERVHLVRVVDERGQGAARHAGLQRSEQAFCARAVAVEVEAGTFTASAEFQAHVMQRLFAPDFGARRAFVEGLAVGNRLPELLDGRARRSTTDATAIYLLLWFYWPEVARLKSVREVAGAQEPFFAENRNAAGANWEERIRKLANRLGLSFRAKQQRRRKPVATV